MSIPSVAPSPSIPTHRHILFKTLVYIVCSALEIIFLLLLEIEGIEDEDPPASMALRPFAYIVIAFCMYIMKIGLQPKRNLCHQIVSRQISCIILYTVVFFSWHKNIINPRLHINNKQNTICERIGAINNRIRTIFSHKWKMGSSSIWCVLFEKFCLLDLRWLNIFK